MAYRIGKRTLDIIGAVTGMAIFLPLAPFIATAIKLDSPGPTLVGLPRVSGGKIITVYKFRSMVEGAHAKKASLRHLNERNDGPFFKMKHDPRVTRVGRVIRKFRFDEFPQLVNVLKGDLSLVGPRPHELEELKSYPSEYAHLIHAKAGVTGLSQVNGASSLPFLKELELDAQYLKQENLITDIKIISKTLVILFADPTAV